MFKTQELVNFLNDGLNAIDENYRFNIYAEIGEQKNDGSINGILRTSTDATTKIANNIETQYTYVVELPIASPRTNSHFLEIQDIIKQFANRYNVTEQKFGSGKGVLHITNGKPKDFKVADNTGDTLPIYFTVEMLYVESCITSLEKHWFLDGYEIPFKNENVLVNKDGIVRKINNKNYTEAFLTGQTRYYKFVFPHQDTPLGNMVQADLLNGDFDKEYTLTYYDGKTYTEEQPFETKVSIYTSGDIGTQEISVDMFNLTFADVDNGEYDWTYQIAFIDNLFDNSTENTRWFNSQAEQQEYYEEKIALPTNCGYETIKAPNINSIDITSQVYPNTNSYNVFDLTNKNYAIIKATKSEPTQQTRYFYYFVTNAQIGANGQVMFDLKLDTIQTYLFNEDIEFGDCYIEKANLNRFVDNLDDTVSFDGGVDSKLFAREDIQDVPKRLTKRTKLGMCNTNDDTEFSDWINENVIGWYYVFLKTNKFKCNVYTTASSDNTRKTGDGDIITLENLHPVSKDLTYISEPLPCIAIPVLKTKYNGTSFSKSILAIKDEFDRETIIAESSYNAPDGTFVNTAYSTTLEFLINDIGTDNIMAVKFSSYCPFPSNVSFYALYNITTLPIGDRKLTLNGSNLSIGTGYAYKLGYNTGIQVFPRQLSQSFVGSFISLTVQPRLYNLGFYEIDKQLTFQKDNIIGSNKSFIFNPKLLSQDYFELQLCDETENGFAYDLQKLNNNNVQIGLTETLVPDNTKKYIRITNNTGIYVPETSENLMGFINNNDTTLIIASTQYANMIANNKNYFTQNALNRDWSLVRSVMGIGTGALQGAALGKFAGSSATGIVGAGISTATGLLTTIGEHVINKTQENLNIDNLKNAPLAVTQALGNSYFSAQYTEPGVYVEEYDILPAEKNVINDTMVQYGFNVNQIGQLEDYLNSSGTNGRKYFNYVKAVVNSIGGISMSNTARDDMRTRFMNGLRFWKSDNIDYDLENYELWLEDDLTGTTWIFNDTLDAANLTSAMNEFNVNFTSDLTNDGTYNQIVISLFDNALSRLEYAAPVEPSGTIYHTAYSVYNGWENNAYKTITIIDGEDVNNTDLIKWLKLNATLKTIKR